MPTTFKTKQWIPKLCTKTESNANSIQPDQLLPKFMKISFIAILCTSFAFAIGTLSGNSSGPPDAQHGEAQNCTSCHDTSAVNSGDGSMSIAGLPSFYTPGETYNLTALVLGSHDRGYGFQLIAKKGSSSIGTLTAVSSGMAIDNEYAEHTTPSSSGIWNFQWTAPMTSDGNITFYASGLSTGGGTGDTGDQVYTFNQTLLPSPSLEWNATTGGDF